MNVSRSWQTTVRSGTRRAIAAQVKRCVLLGAATLTLIVLSGCPPLGGTSTSDITVAQAPYDATVQLDLRAPGRPVNRLVLGTGIQWVDDGDHLLVPGTTTFDSSTLSLARQLAPTVIRYPGGSQGDTYHWRDGIGPLAQRKTNELFFKKGAQQKITFGTAEFLELCRLTGAEPLITVNATTGTASEAAAWVEQVNRTGLRSPTGTRLPAVRYWEVDNEPYLRNDARPEFEMPAGEFARRANEFIREMRKADPSIVIGIPMRSDTVGAIRLPQQVDRFASTVLTQVTERFDYVALHNAYFPFIWNPLERRSEEEVFRATMAASRAVAADFEQTRQLLKRHKPGQSIKIAVTEFNSLFAMFGGKEGHIATLGSALYVADLLRLFAESDDVLLANFWSLSNNWYFGAIGKQLPSSREAQPRPAFHILSAFRDVLRGRIIPSRVQSPTFDSPTVGLLPAYTGTPSLASLATVDGDRVRILLINKDRYRPANVALRTSNGQLAMPTINVLSDSFLFSVDRGRSAVSWRQNAAQGATISARAEQVLRVPPHSVVWAEYRSSGR
ncbi:MAG: hypothetical protein ACO1Q7_01485 [Gemmatimonas sp.]